MGDNAMQTERPTRWIRQVGRLVWGGVMYP